MASGEAAFSSASAGLAAHNPRRRAAASCSTVRGPVVAAASCARCSSKVWLCIARCSIQAASADRIVTTACVPRGLKLKIPAWVFCMSWRAECEFRGDRTGQSSAASCGSSTDSRSSIDSAGEAAARHPQQRTRSKHTAHTRAAAAAHEHTTAQPQQNTRQQSGAQRQPGKAGVLAIKQRLSSLSGTPPLRRRRSSAAAGGCPQRDAQDTEKTQSTQKNDEHAAVDEKNKVGTTTGSR